MQYQASFESPIGFLILKSDGQSIISISFSENDIQEQNSCAVLETCKEQLASYFAGKLLSFDLPLSPDGTEFQLRVWAELPTWKWRFVLVIQNVSGQQVQPMVKIRLP